MGMHPTDQFDFSTQKSVPLEQFNYNFDLWAKAVRQQMLEALENPSEFVENEDDLEDLSEPLDDESEEE